MFASKFFLAVSMMVSAALALQIDSPATLQECVPVALTWSGGTAPYYLSAIPGGQPSAAALTDFGNVGSVTSYTWTVSLASGTVVTMKISDSTGTIAYSGEVTIMAGTSTTCLASNTASAASNNATTAASTGGATSAVVAVSTSASSAVAAATSSAASAVSAATASAASKVSSASSAAAAGATSASSKASSAAAAGTSAATSAAAAATSAASGAGKVVAGSIGALFFGAVGVLFA